MGGGSGDYHSLKKQGDLALCTEIRDGTSFIRHCSPANSSLLEFHVGFALLQPRLCTYSDVHPIGDSRAYSQVSVNTIKALHGYPMHALHTSKAPLNTDLLPSQHA